MSLLTGRDFKYILIFFCVVGAGMFVTLLNGFLGYMTTSGRQPYCKAESVDAGLCPLNFFLAAGDFLLVWMGAMAISVLPILVAVALLVAMIRWQFGRPLQPGE